MSKENIIANDIEQLFATFANGINVYGYPVYQHPWESPSIETITSYFSNSDWEYKVMDSGDKILIPLSPCCDVIINFFEERKRYTVTVVFRYGNIEHQLPLKYNTGNPHWQGFLYTNLEWHVAYFKYLKTIVDKMYLWLLENDKRNKSAVIDKPLIRTCLRNNKISGVKLVSTKEGIMLKKNLYKFLTASLLVNIQNYQSDINRYGECLSKIPVLSEEGQEALERLQISACLQIHSTEDLQSIGMILKKSPLLNSDGKRYMDDTELIDFINESDDSNFRYYIPTIYNFLKECGYNMGILPGKGEDEVYFCIQFNSMILFGFKYEKVTTSFGSHYELSLYIGIQDGMCFKPYQTIIEKKETHYYDIIINGVLEFFQYITRLITPNEAETLKEGEILEPLTRLCLSKLIPQNAITYLKNDLVYINFLPERGGTNMFTILLRQDLLNLNINYNYLFNNTDEPYKVRDFKMISQWFNNFTNVLFDPKRKHVADDINLIAPWLSKVINVMNEYPDILCLSALR